jgi:hypothetical protein
VGHFQNKRPLGNTLLLSIALCKEFIEFHVRFSSYGTHLVLCEFFEKKEQSEMLV